MVRKGCCPKEGLNRGAWTSQEDKLLSDYIKVHGLGRWRNLPAKAGLNRCGKSCRLRWLNYLRPDIKRGNIAEEEEELIIRLHKLLGNRWSLIAGRLPGRTDNEIKNYWNTYLRKKASDHRSEHHSSMETKKDPSKDSSSELKECSEVNVIRTKAVRCTRPLFADPFPSIVTNNYQDSLVPTDPLAPNFLWDFDGSSAAPPASNEGVDGFSMMEMMRNSFFAKDGSCMDSDGLYNIDAIDAIVNEDNHVGGGIYNGEMDEGEGLYSFLDDVDAWDSMAMPQ